jgi:hypothetical protein
MRTANAAIGRAEGAVDELALAVEAVMAPDGGGHAEAAAGAASWTANCKQDLAWRQAMVLKMRQGGQVYNEEETALIEQGLALLDSVAAGTGKARSLRHSKTVTSAWTKHDKSSGLLIGHVEATVRASPEEIGAFVMHVDSKVKLSELDPELEVRYEILEVKNLHHIVVFYEVRTAPFRNRTFMSSSIWRKVCDAPLTYIWATIPIERHDKVSPEQEAHAVRAHGSRCLKLTRLGCNLTRVRFACSLDLKGQIPRRIVNRIALPQLMRTPYDLQTYFVQMTPPSECTAADGTCIGHMIADVAQAAKTFNRAAAIRTFIMRSSVLRECGFASFDELIIAIFLRHSFRKQVAAMIGVWKLNSRLAQAVESIDPAMLTVAEAETIGIGFDRIIVTSATPNEAVDELLLKYPALGVTAQQQMWFRPMLEAIAKRRMASAPLGLKLRLAIGVGFSMADMVSDLYSIVNMLQTGQAMGAYGMIGLISASLAMQLLLVIFQTKHLGGRAVAWEVILVLCLVKPGVDAMRVSSGAEHAAGAPLDPFTEMLTGKCFEIACEAAPGAALQAAVVLGGNLSTAAVVSVGISCISTGFTTAMMAFDMDTNPAKRKHTPQFFGYIPQNRRLLIFVELFTLHTAHAMVRTLTIAMLARTNSRWLVAYMAADFCVFVTYKIARGDLLWWAPGAAMAYACAYRRCAAHGVDCTLHALDRSRGPAVLARSVSREGDPR